MEEPMSTVVPVPGPDYDPPVNSLDALNVVVEGNEDTTVRPADPKHLPHLLELKRLLEEREQRLKAERERQEPPPSPPAP
jgi:hypothetical protein